MTNSKIVITGGAGMLGFALVKELLSSYPYSIHVVDKREHRLTDLRGMYPQINVTCSELMNVNSVQEILANTSTLIICHAVVNGLKKNDFDTVSPSTEILMSVAKSLGIFVVFVGTQACSSKIPTFYSESKRLQEQIVRQYDVDICIVRPTLLYGPYDDKHLTLIANLLKKFHFMIIPGHGNFIRQPLFSLDLAKIITSVVMRRTMGVYDICGPEKISFINLVQKIGQAQKIVFTLIRIPISIFKIILTFANFIVPSFKYSREHLASLIADETFHGVDVSSVFGIKLTSLERGIALTFEEDLK